MKTVLLLVTLVAVIFFGWRHLVPTSKIQVASVPDGAADKPIIPSGEPSNIAAIRNTNSSAPVQVGALEETDRPKGGAVLPNPFDPAASVIVKSRSANSKEFIETKLRSPDRRGEERAFKQAGRNFRTLPGVWALTKNEVRDNQNLSPITQLFAYSIVKGPTQSPEKGLPVVFDTDRGTIGVLTGKLSVKYHNAVAVADTTARYNLDLIQEFPEIKTAIFQMTSINSDDLFSKFEALKLDSAVQRVRLDIFETMREAN